MAKAKAKKTSKKAKKTLSFETEDGEVLSLESIRDSLYKKCKDVGVIDQSEIDEAFAQYDLDDDAVSDLISFFKGKGKL